MKRILATLLLILYIAGPYALAQRAHSGGPRPYYGGGHHTSSHGGSYGTAGSSHRGGHYTSQAGSHRYGRHKVK
jgi:hypothetical protein